MPSSKAVNNHAESAPHIENFVSAILSDDELRQIKLYAVEQVDRQRHTPVTRSGEIKEASYKAWQEERLAGLVRTYAHDGIDASQAEWHKVAHFEGPGTWYTTGDSWYMAEIDGHICYQCHYGNALVSYAPQVIADRWCEQRWQWLVNDVYNGNQSAAARQLLIDSQHDYIGSDIAKRLIEIHGAQHFVQLATQDEWWVYGQDTLDWAGQAARHYGTDCVYLQAINVGAAPFTAGRYYLPGNKLVQSYWRHPDGRIVARGYRFDEMAVVDVADLPPSIQKLINHS